METTTPKSMKNYCIAIDGSQHSDWAFNLVFEELFQKGDKITLVHISNGSKDVPFAFQPKTIISKYDAKLTGRLSTLDFKIVQEEKKANVIHALLQVNDIALANKCTMLVLGFQGHKDNKENISRGVNYVIDNIKLPTIVVKENITRKSKDSGAFTFCTSIEQANTRSFKAFQFAVNYIDVTKDKVLGMHIKIYNDSFIKEVKEYFEATCTEKGVKNFAFQPLENEKDVSVGEQICNFANYNEKESIDFLILGHNPIKYKTNADAKNSSPLNTAIKSAKTNILFFS